MRSILIRLIIVTVAVIATMILVALASESETARTVLGWSVMFVGLASVLLCAFARKPSGASEENP